MKKIKKIINKIIKKYMEYFNKFLITNISLAMLTLMFIIFREPYENDILRVISNSLICFASINLLIESTYKKEDKKRLYLYVISFLLAIAGGFLFSIENDIIHNLFIGIIIILMLLSLYQTTKAKKDLPNYLRKVFFNLFKVELFTMVLILGFGVIYIIVDALIIEGYEIQFYDKIVYFIIGFYNIPFTIISFDNVKEDVPEIINSLLRNVLQVLLDISFVVIIVYIFKILVTGELPDNQIFIVVLMLFLFMYPMIIMLNNYEGKIEKFNTKYLPYIFIAPLLLQLYSLIIRVSTYGFTTTRYVGAFLIIFETIALFLYVFKDKKFINVNLLVLIGISVILFVLPYTNLYEAPLCLQIRRLETMWTEKTSENDITKEQRQKIKDIYEYLKDYENPNKYMPSYLTMEKINKYLMNTRDKFEGEKSEFYTFKNEKQFVDISKYSKLERYDYYGSGIDLEHIVIIAEEKEYKIGSFVKEMMMMESYPQELTIELENENIFYIENFSFYYDSLEGKLENIALVGYILYK